MTRWWFMIHLTNNSFIYLFLFTGYTQYPIRLFAQESVFANFFFTWYSSRFCFFFPCRADFHFAHKIHFSSENVHDSYPFGCDFFFSFCSHGLFILICFSSRSIHFYVNLLSLKPLIFTCGFFPTSCSCDSICDSFFLIFLFTRFVPFDQLQPYTLALT